MKTDQTLPGDLLSSLDARDLERFARLCRDNLQTIVGSFASWVTPPASLAVGSATYHAYMNGLYFISKHLADDLGVPVLFGQLVSPDSPNPFAVWEGKINQSLDLSKQMRWDEADQVLANHLIDCRELR